MKSLAGAYQAAEQFDRWIPLYEELIKLQTTTLGPEHPDTLAAKWKLGEHYRQPGGYYSIPMLEEVWNVRKRTLPEGDKLRINTENLLGMVLTFAGRYPEAETHLLASYRDLSTSQVADPAAPMSYSRRLVYLYAEWDKPAELAQWRAELKKFAGPYRSPLDGSGYLILFRRSQFRAAEAVLADHLTFSERTQPDGWGTAHARFLLGCALLGRKKLADAEPLLLAGYAGLKLRESNIPPDTRPLLAEMVAWLARRYEELDQMDEAAKWRSDGENLSTARYEDLLKALSAQLGPRHPDTIAMTSTLANLYRDGGDLPRAVPLFQQLWDAAKHDRPEGDKFRIDTQNQLGLALLLAGRPADAGPHLLASHKDALKTHAFPKDWQLVYVVRLVSLYAEWDRPDEVARWQTELRNFGDEAETWLSGTGSQMLKATRFRAAELLLRDCLALRRKLRPDDWRTFETKSLLGGALLGRKNATDAEALLLAGYEGLKARGTKIPQDGRPRLTDAAARLVQLYETLGEEDKALKWRNELEARRLSNE